MPVHAGTDNWDLEPCLHGLAGGVYVCAGSVPGHLTATETVPTRAIALSACEWHRALTIGSDVDLPVGVDPSWRRGGHVPKPNGTELAAWLGGLALMLFGPLLDLEADLGWLEGRTIYAGVFLWAASLLGLFAGAKSDEPPAELPSAPNREAGPVPTQRRPTRRRASELEVGDQVAIDGRMRRITWARSHGSSVTITLDGWQSVTYDQAATLEVIRGSL